VLVDVIVCVDVLVPVDVCVEVTVIVLDEVLEGVLVRVPERLEVTV
jgi:hypothetical protein